MRRRRRRRPWTSAWVRLRSTNPTGGRGCPPPPSQTGRRDGSPKPSRPGTWSRLVEGCRNRRVARPSTRRRPSGRSGFEGWDSEAWREMCRVRGSWWTLAPGRRLPRQQRTELGLSSMPKPRAQLTCLVSWRAGPPLDAPRGAPPLYRSGRCDRDSCRTCVRCEWLPPAGRQRVDRNSAAAHDGHRRSRQELPLTRT